MTSVSQRQQRHVDEVFEDRSVVGYARVSADLQCLEAQHYTLTVAGCERLFIETLSGVRDDRPGLAALL